MAIPIRVAFPAVSRNAIAATQTITATAGAGFILNGVNAPAGRNTTPSATTIPAATTTFTWVPVELPGIARTITVTATNSATNCIFTIVGRDLRGNVITATIIGASGGSATASDSTATTNGVDFHVITGVITSASCGPMTVGFGATGVTNWYEVNQFNNPFVLNVGAAITLASITTYSVVSTLDNVQTATAPVTATTGPVVNLATINFFGAYTATIAPVAAVQGWVTGNTATTGGVNFTFVQAGV